MSSSTNSAPLVFVRAEEVARCAALVISTWKVRRDAQNEKEITRWTRERTGYFWSRRFYTRDEATNLMLCENPFAYATPRWVQETELLGNAAVVAQSCLGALIQLSPEQVGWLWPEIDPRIVATSNK